MKAYKVYIPDHWEGYQDIVFAESHSKAKAKAMSIGESCQGSEWVNLRVNRLPYLDGMENRTRKEIMYVAILHGWWYEVDGVWYDEDNMDEAVDKDIITPVKSGYNV